MDFPYTVESWMVGALVCGLAKPLARVALVTLAFYNSKNIVVSGLTSLNSQMFHMVVYGCTNSKLQGLKILASASSPNTDGIHLQLSSGVSILNSGIATGDDCVSIGPGNSNLWIKNVACGPGHGISIGSLGWDMQEPGIQNVTVKSVTFKGTDNGVRIKTWARASSAYVKGILFQHLVMVNVQNPVIIDQVSGVKISDVTYQNIHGTSEHKLPKQYPCSRIKLEDVNLTYKTQPAVASCLNAGGTTSGLVAPT
ncbi:hypothetical protein RJ640_023888, partial [Escallonia rubra]